MNNSKIISSKTTISLFLAIVLFAGTITAIFPSSFIIKGVNAQRYYDDDGEIYNRYNSYQSEYPQEYKDNNNDYYNSYEPRDYGMDNGYYDSQYQQSYQSDYYKPAEYPSYDDKDIRDKSKKDSSSKKSVSTNKIKCNNANNNIDGDVIGNVSVGNSGGGALTGNSFGNYGEGYYDGYNKNPNGITCIINNNNNNTNIGGGAGNQTIPPGPPEPTTGNLTVIKGTTCELTSEICNPPPDPQITVSGTNPTPSTFTASDTPIVVKLGTGSYEVNEAGFLEGLEQCTSRGFEGGQHYGDPDIFICTNFSDNCEGSISAGEELTCTITNVVIDTNVPPQTAQLTVNKTTTCDPRFGNLCDIDYNLTVTGNDPTPSTFTASDNPIVVKLGAGVYSVNETGFVPGLASCAGFDGGQEIGPGFNACTNFSDNCSGNIGIGEELTCNIENTVIDANVPPGTPSLNVIKLVTCGDQNGENSPSCADLLGNITEDQFNFGIISTSPILPVPNQFSGSETGTVVRLGIGNYRIDETIDASVVADISALGGNITGPNVSFTGSCTQIDLTIARGTISSIGGPQFCDITNEFIIEEDDTTFTTASSSIIAQGTNDLTATEKIEKLQAQYVELYQ